ncbi:hypothetical protein [Sphingomonas sp.]|uniref:hypothetical protein n=1 Tax=Sphingomonas sp. TaxID=28214 RepID=UPI0035C84B14
MIFSPVMLDDRRASELPYSTEIQATSSGKQDKSTVAIHSHARCASDYQEQLFAALPTLLPDRPIRSSFHSYLFNDSHSHFGADSSAALGDPPYAARSSARRQTALHAGNVHVGAQHHAH